MKILVILQSLNICDRNALNNIQKLKKITKVQIDLLACGCKVTEEFLKEADALVDAQSLWITKGDICHGRQVFRVVQYLQQMKGKYDCIFLGCQSPEQLLFPIGTEFAEYLNIGHVWDVDTIIAKDSEILISSNFIGCNRCIRMKMPCVLFFGKRIVRLNYPTVASIIKSGKKVIHSIRIKESKNEKIVLANVKNKLRCRVKQIYLENNINSGLEEICKIICSLLNN